MPGAFPFNNYLLAPELSKEISAWRESVESTSTMDTYRHPPGDLPRYLYRVQYRGNTGLYNKTSGLKARDTTTQFARIRATQLFKDAVADHFDWSSTRPTPFITFFSVEQHAVRWALCLERWGRSEPGEDDWFILTINTSTLTDVHFFKLSTLVDRFGLGSKIDSKVQESHKRGAYICLHGIPARAIDPGKTKSKFDVIGRKLAFVRCCHREEVADCKLQDLRKRKRRKSLGGFRVFCSAFWGSLWGIESQRFGAVMVRKRVFGNDPDEGFEMHAYHRWRRSQSVARAARPRLESELIISLSDKSTLHSKFTFYSSLKNTPASHPSP